MTDDMLLHEEPRVAPYHAMVKIIRDGMKKKYNRSFKKFPPLDKEGINILNPVMVHNHIAGVPALPHIRCFAYLKLEGQDSPDEIVLDVDKDKFYKLLTVTEWKELAHA